MSKTEKSLIAGGIVIIIISIASIVWQSQRDKTVISTEPAGIAQTAQFMPSIFRNGSTTEIITDKGTFLANGTFQLIKGDELYIEKRESGKRFICGHKNCTCKELE